MSANFCEDFVNADFVNVFCERYKPCKMVKKDALQVYLQRRLFLLFYRATARQQGNSFPSCAWRISQLHRDFSLAFARRFLDLTTFYDKSADDPFTVITFSVSMLHYLSSVFFI